MTHRRLQVLTKAFWLAVALIATQAPVFADPVPVQHVEGTLHGFLVVRNAAGRVIAAGDYEQTIEGDHVSAHALFQFKDGSVNEESAEYSQKGEFRLIRYHQIQKGPSFPRAVDLSIDAAHGEVKVITKSKDGMDETSTEHMDLPPDLYNGMIGTVVKNVATSAAETRISLLVTTPKPRIVKLVISPQGEDRFLLGGFRRRATHYTMKIELGGLTGVVAPLVGKQPPNLQIWIVDGKAPTFAKQVGPMFADGPIWSIELTGPTWPKPPRR